MAFPERFSNLPDYAFPRLRKLLDAHAPGGDPIAMTIGEPRHPMPDFVGGILAAQLDGFAVYPPNDGTPELLAAISDWIARRYGVAVAEDRLMVLNGTREGLFNACLAISPETKGGKAPVVLMPNPFYQVYTVAAVTAGAEAAYVPATAATGHLPDFAGLPADLVADHALIDGNLLPRGLTIPAQAVVKGDAKSLSIAAASICAKVTRDRLMVDLAQQYPGYGWEANAGYPTKAHLQALLNLGVTPVHRRSFKPVHNILYQDVSVSD